VRNPIRNSLHKELKDKYSDILKARISTSDLEHRVLNEEPKLADYFERVNPAPEQLNNDPIHLESSQFDRRGFENNVKVRADLVVHNILNPHRSLVIDFTFIEPTARTYVGTYNKTGQAALKGRQNKISKEYKHWNVSGSNLVENIFKVIAFETFGVVIKEDIIATVTPFINEKENPAQVINLVIQQLSVALHTIRANQFITTQSTQVLRERPQFPLRNKRNSLNSQASVD
jgi:hypothetical protein